jgi:lysylphosphatidylglycerol synthetase-like protein (DUF2156 family)
MTEILAPPDAALAAIQRYADSDNPSAFLAVNEGNSYFQLPGTPGVIVYRPAGQYLVVFGGPFAPLDARAAMLRAFIEFAAEQGREIVAVQLQAPDVPEYRAEKFMVNQIGASYAVSLDGFSLRGTYFMQLRNKIARSLKAGLAVSEATQSQWDDAMHKLDAVWLRDKGEDVRQMEYLVGQYGGPYQPLRRLFIGQLDGELAGYISYSPVYGSRPGWMHDLSRRIPSGPPGVMEAINKFAIERFIAEKVPWLHFGFTPFSSLSTEVQFPGYSHAFAWFMEQLWQYGEQVYPAQTQLAYKQKWAPDVVLPEYVAFQHRASIPAFVHIFRACGAVG